MPVELEELLLSSLESARVGQGRLVLVTGDSGLGKTFRIGRFLRSLPEETCLILKAKARPQASTPFCSFYEGLNDYLDQHASEAATRRIISRHYVVLPGLRALASPFLNDDSFIRTESDLFRGSGPAQAVHFANLFREMAGEKTLVLFLDDFQWADRESLNLVHYLFDYIVSKRILLVLSANLRHKGTADREYLDIVLSYIHRNAEEIASFLEVQPVSPEQLSILIEDILGAAVHLSTEGLKALAAKTRGYPFVVKTFVQFLVDTGDLQLLDGVYSLVRDIKQIPLPQGLREELQRRIRSAYRIMPEARPVLEMASVLGERFRDSEIDEILQLCEAYRLLSKIEENQLLVRELLAAGLWEFEHVIVRDFIYDTLGDRAASLHLRIGEHLIGSESRDFQRIAYHFELAGAEQRSMEASLHYSEWLLRQGNFREARHVLDSLWSKPGFLSLPAYLESQLEIELNRALCAFYLAEYDSCLQQIAHIRALLPQASSDPRLLFLRCRCLNKSNTPSDFEEARLSLQAISTSLHVKSDPRFAGRIFAELVVSCGRLNRFIEARAAFEEARRLLATDPIDHARLIRRSIVVYEPELAIVLLRQALAVLDGVGVVHEKIMVVNNICVCHITMREYSEAEKQLTPALVEAVQLGNFRLDYLLSNRGSIRLLHGDASGALEDYNEAARFSRRRVNVLCINNNQAAALISLGHVDDAACILQNLLLEADLVQEDYYIVHISYNLALCHLIKGRYRSALLMLTGMSIKRLPDFGFYYSKRRDTLIRTSLVLLGATMENQLDEGWTVPDPVIMEFWGD